MDSQIIEKLAIVRKDVTAKSLSINKDRVVLKDCDFCGSPRRLVNTIKVEGVEHLVLDDSIVTSYSGELSAKTVSIVSRCDINSYDDGEVVEPIVIKAEESIRVENSRLSRITLNSPVISVFGSFLFRLNANPDAKLEIKQSRILGIDKDMSPVNGAAFEDSKIVLHCIGNFSFKRCSFKNCYIEATKIKESGNPLFEECTFENVMYIGDRHTTLNIREELFSNCKGKIVYCGEEFEMWSIPERFSFFGFEGFSYRFPFKEA